MPYARKGSSHTRLDSLCTAENLAIEFFDTPVHIHIHMVTMHEYRTIMMVAIYSLRAQVYNMYKLRLYPCNYKLCMKCHSREIFQ